MKTQKFIWDNNFVWFAEEFNKLLESGWSVVPLTMIVQENLIGCVVEKETVDTIKE